MLGARNPCRSRAIDDHAHFADVFADELDGIDQRRTGDDRSPVLVVVEDRNLHRLAQSLFNLETIGRFDVFQVDSAKRGLEKLTEPDNFLGIVAIDLDIEHVHVGKALEQDGFAFHHGFARQSPDIAQAKNRGSVADDRDQIAAVGVFESVVRILFDLKTRLGHARRVGQTEVPLCAARLGGNNFCFPRARSEMIIERLLLVD